MKREPIAIDNTVNKSWNITEALNKLKRKGYKLEFRREASCVYCFQWQQWIMPANFMVDESYYFEEIANPGGKRMLYAISLWQGGKAFLIDTCNVYMDSISNEMIQNLNRVSNHSAVVVDAIMITNQLKMINQAS